MKNENPDPPQRLGPRGGRSYATPGGLIRKGVSLRPDQAEALRWKAFRERRSESDVLREALDRLLGLEPPA